MLAGRWLIEISAPDGNNADRAKENQLLWCQYHAGWRGLGERVALFYNGREATTPPPLSCDFSPHAPIVAMHFLADKLLALPEAMMRDEKEREQNEHFKMSWRKNEHFKTRKNEHCKRKNEQNKQYAVSQ